MQRISAAISGLAGMRYTLRHRIEPPPLLAARMGLHSIHRRTRTSSRAPRSSNVITLAVTLSSGSDDFPPSKSTRHQCAEPCRVQRIDRRAGSPMSARTPAIPEPRPVSPQNAARFLVIVGLVLAAAILLSSQTLFSTDFLPHAYCFAGNNRSSR